MSRRGHLRGPARAALVTTLIFFSVPTFADTPADAADAPQLRQQQPAPARVQSLRRLNTPNRFATPARTVEALRKTFSAPAMQKDVARVLEGAGVGSLQADVLRILSEGQVMPGTMAPGTVMEWMALRRARRPGIMRNVRWDGR